MSPYASVQQRKFFHTKTARAKGITAAEVKEYDQTSKGMKLPERAPKMKIRARVRFKKRAK